MKMTKKEMAGFLTVTMLILGGAVAAAAAPQPGAEQQRPFKDRMDVKMQELYQELNLTPDQKKQLDENKAKNHEQMKAIFQAMREKMSALREELQKDSLNMERVTQLNGDLKALQAQMLDHRLEGILAVRKILTAEQFKKFMAKMEEQKERTHQNWGGKGDGKKGASEPPNW